MNPRSLLQAVWTMALAGGLALVSPAASAVPVTPQFRFLNFYATGLYSRNPDNVEYRVNGSQLCAWGPASGSTTTTDCGARGDGGMPLPETGTPVTSVEWYLINWDEPAATREWFHNSVSFTPGPAHDITLPLPSDRFLFGTLTYTNGSWASVSDARVELSYELSFTTGNAVLDAAYDFEYSGVLVVAATPNNGPTRDSRADFVYLADEPELGSLRAFEFGDVNYVPGANTVSVDIYGNLASVHFTDFANVRGGGFVNPSVSLQLIPEPETLPLVLAGCAALLAARRRGHPRVASRPTR